MTRPFEGIRVIDVTHVLAGPFAAYQLGVLGAEVIKMTPPPQLGADTDTILAELGYGPHEIAEFRGARIV